MNTEISTQPSYQGYTLLIVDDNPTNLGVLTDYLEEQGFEIHSHFKKTDIEIALDCPKALKNSQSAKRFGTNLDQLANE